MALDDVHVLQRRRMEDEIGLKRLEAGEDLGAVRYAAEALLDL
jgi:hypothetical protein